MKYTKIKEFFEMGFEEIEAEPLVNYNKAKRFFIHKNDIINGGKFSTFADYTRDRFEREFSVMLSFR